MYQELINNQKDYSKLTFSNDYQYRLKKLVKLKEVITNNITLISEALFLDLGKDETESYLTEISLVLGELNYLIKNLKNLMKPKKVKTPLSLFPAKSFLVAEKLGVVLVISPWNYPFLLALNPVLAAFAAGNSVILKPSEFISHTNEVIIKIIDEVFIKEEVSVVLGEVKETTELLTNRFDHIFFTGSTNVGKVIMQAASKHLTPITLELGGKSPVIVFKDSNLKLAAKRIAFGKLINAGQTCIAPDYLLIEENLKQEFIDYFNYYVEEFYSKEPLNSNNYPKIINEKNLKRLEGLIEPSKIISGGRFNESKLTPTLVDASYDDLIMQEEIFGPILPIITFKDIETVEEHLLKSEKPLAMYVFTNSKFYKNYFTKTFSSGSLVFNDTIVQFANLNLPFGGVGSSGMGKYHGIESFKTFSHYKAILDKKTYLDVKMRYQPYDKKKSKFLKRVIK